MYLLLLNCGLWRSEGSFGELVLSYYLMWVLGTELMSSGL